MKDGTASTIVVADNVSDEAWSSTGRYIGYTLSTPQRGTTARQGTIVRDAETGDVVLDVDGQFAGWSPDGRKLLLMRDVGPRPPGSSLPPCASRNDFTMRAVTVQTPFASTTIASYVCTDGDRAWPGYGDVSWQPLPRR